MYGVAAIFFFLVGGLEALLIRTQLAFPENGFLSADVYNQIFTMHGVTMIFLFVMPFAAAFANYLIPLQIGARDVAFPRLNALSFWVWLSGAIFLNTSWIVGGGGADCGWFCYSPNSGITFSPTNPWDDLDASIEEGSKISGKVVSVADYGAFIEIKPGVEGLVHVSEMSWSSHLRNPSEYLSQCNALPG